MTSVATHPPLGALVWTRSRTRVPPVVTMALRESPKRVFESMDADGTDPALIEHLHWMHVGDCAPRTIYERRRLITRLGYWFPAMNLPGGHMAASPVSAAISRAFQRAGVAGTGHRLRHTFGTAVYAQGKDIRATQDLLRHKWITTTQVYADSPMSDRRAIVDTLTV